MMNPPRSSASSLEPILRWRKGELIGVGAFGSVYMGMNLDSGELLAVKQVLISSSSRQKAQAHLKELEEEVKLLKNLSHPNIVDMNKLSLVSQYLPYVHLGVWLRSQPILFVLAMSANYTLLYYRDVDGFIFIERYMGTARDENALNIFLEFVPGGSIASLLNKFGPFPELVIKMYTRQILQGLEYLHKNAIMHRDIKGANILVDNKGQIKLADFGASKQVVELVTTTGSKSIKGTPYWMAPEVIRQTGHTLSADIWSVACTVIEMATGKAPWSDQFQEVSALFHIGTTKSHPPIPEYLSHVAQDFLLKCLKQEPHLRPTASDLLEHPFIKLDGNSTMSSLIQVPHGTKVSQVVDKCKRRHLTGHKVENPCAISTIERDSLEIFTPNVNSGRESVDNDFNCSVRLDYDSSMKSFKSASDDLFCIRTQSFDPTMELSTVNSMGNPPDVDDVLCNLASPEIIRNKDDDNSTMTMAHAYNNNDPSFYSFKCTVDENDDDNEDVTEAKIKAFLEEKASELKRLQSPLYMEFHSSWNFELNQEESTITSCENQIQDTIIPRSWLSKASSQSGVSTARSTVSEPSFISSGSYGSGIHRVNLSTCSDSTTQLHDLKEHFLDTQYPSAHSPSILSSRDQLKLWKEELQQELQMRREEKKMLSRLTSVSQGATPRSLKRKLP